MRNNKRIYSIILVFALVFAIFCVDKPQIRALATLYGQVSEGVTNLNFREAPNGNIVKDTDGKNIRLNAGHPLTILDTSNSAWYKVSIEYKGVGYTGYVSSKYVTINQEGDVQPEENPEPPLGDASFEDELTAQGFPESYKPYLRKIHESYPDWKFKAIHTGIDWNTVVSKEVNKTGQIKNLVWTSNSYPHYNWRSTTVGYNWSTDTWSPYDGKVWFAASDPLVTYYLDPRTYLYENYIFVFESLSYQEGTQNEIGVEAILKGSFMYNTIPNGETKTYAQIILDAAKESGVSPYHIASRIRQEMGTTAGVAALGTSTINPGIYNYFNIGAVDTANGSAVEKGIAWAAAEGSYGRPWNTVSKSIVGGSKYLGASYISVGQNTLYTQKFNVTNKGNLFSHQYMTNVQAPANECLTNYNAYKANNLLCSSMVFEIPVYTNMPDVAVSKPADSGNPNNWLKTLSVSGYSLTPTFAVNTTNEYSLILPENVSNVNISGTTVNPNAKILGSGKINLKPGTNIVPITVTAQNGQTRTYTLTIVCGESGDVNPVQPQPEDPDEPDKPEDTPANVLRGDLNKDGKITTIDIVMLQRLIVGIDSYDTDTLYVGDVNGDGKISAIDIVVIQRHIVGIEAIK